MKEFNGDALADLNGKAGQPAGVAFQGKVIDVSSSRLWKEGVHMNRHRAGQDLTADIEAAPHGPDVLERFPQLGILKREEEAAGFLPESLEKLLTAIPFLRRHPHPMLVHFPIVLFILPMVFYTLFLLSGDPSFETTALHCLGGGILFSLPAVLSGFFAWWVNYQLKPSKPVRIKILFSFLLAALSIFAFWWRLTMGVGIFYFLLLLSLVPLVSVIGWYGATLTFPIEKA